jgi:tetratricopeptide (TPR) repeat protein
MIVKNEEKFIQGCLNSVKSIVDEIVIVDTGSTDSTLDLIRPFNAKIVHYPWSNDFAAARNVGLELAKTPWILMLDADERIAVRDLHLVVEATQRDCTGFELLWRNYGFNPVKADWHVNTGEYEEGNGFPGFTQDTMFRLYRNDPRLRYEGVVHEHVTWKTFPGARVQVIRVVIHHYGRALAQERLAEKGNMYLELGYQKIEQFPDRWEPYYEIGLQLQEFERFAESIPFFEKALARTLESDMRGLLLFHIGFGFKQSGQMEKAIEQLELAVATGYDRSTIRLTMANIYSALGDTARAIQQYDYALGFKPNDPLVLLNYGLLLRDAGDIAGAESMYRAALAANGKFTLAAIELAALLSARNRFTDAAALLEDVLKREPACIPARQGLAKIYILVQRPDDALRLLEGPQDDLTSETLRGAAHLERGELELARSIFEDVLKRDRNFVGARVNLAHVYARMGDFSRAVRHVVAAYEQTRDKGLLEMARNFQMQASMPVASSVS